MIEVVRTGRFLTCYLLMILWFFMRPLSLMNYLSWLLMWFETISSLKINLSKCEVIPFKGVENLEDLAYVLGCKVGNFPTTYLGLPLGAPSNCLVVWDGVEDRFRRRLSMWKR